MSLALLLPNYLIQTRMFVVITIQAFLMLQIRGEVLHSDSPCREPDAAEMDRKQRGILENYMYMSEVINSHVFTRFDQDCPSYRLPKKGENFPLCPTFQELDFDATRIPSQIIQTRCRCKNCVLRHKHRHHHICKPVLRHIPVLKKVGCVAGVYEYREFLQEVAVTCVCMKKHVLQQDNRNQLGPVEEPRRNDTMSYSITGKIVTDFEPGSEIPSSVHTDDIQAEDHRNDHQYIFDHSETEKMPK